MESVQRHLRGRLTHRLGADAAHHLAGMNDSTLEDFFDSSYKLVKARTVKAIFNDYLLGTEVTSQEDLEKHNRVHVSLANNAIILKITQASLRKHTQLVK